MPASIFVHAIAVIGVIVVPLLAPSLLPTPQSVLAFAASPPPPPAPPPPPPPAEPPPSPPTDAPADVIPDAAPSEAPDNFTPEPDRVVSPPRLVATGVERSRIDAGSGVVLEAPPPSPQRVYRIGGDIKEPKLLVRVEPTYPAVARAAKMRGPVYVEAIIGKDGRVRDATATSGVPFAVLREAAVAAVRQWIYTPTSLNGQPVEVQLHVVVQFELR